MEEERAKIWKKDNEKIMNKENNRDQINGTDVKKPVERATREEFVEAFQKMKSRKATGPLEM